MGIATGYIYIHLTLYIKLYICLINYILRLIKLYIKGLYIFNFIYLWLSPVGGAATGYI